ncbi:GH3 auxin-responsive promoter family protein, partial [bacterium]|nr:GH3 auxin-responsive promoter family protein [bacterium]
MTESLRTFFIPFLQAAWMSTCFLGAMRFKLISRAGVRTVQTAVLKKIIRENKDTVFGKKHNFHKIFDSRGFKLRVPVSDYDDLKPFVIRASEGEKCVLSSDPIFMFERSSGSSSPSKLIPWTKKLRDSFNKGIDPWMWDLYSRRLNLWGGKAYWVISPAASDKKNTPSGIPIGFEDDAAYLGGWSQKFVDELMAVPSWVKFLSNIDSFRYVSLLFLLRAQDLRLISLWNPTFLPLLLQNLFEWREQLGNDLHHGTCFPPNLRNGLSFSNEKEILDKFYRPANPMPIRAKEFLSICNCGNKSHATGLGEKLWPHLDLISTWTKGEARFCLKDLKEWFPNVRIQGKGLLSTESIVTIPIEEAVAPVLAASSGFFEFQEGIEG